MGYTIITEVLTDMLRGSVLAHAGILQHVTLLEGEKSGNKISVWNAQRSTADDITGALLTADKDNLIASITCADKAIRHSWTPSEYNTLVRMNAFDKIFAMDADALGILMEQALDTLLTSGTVTGSLATDNTFTLAEFMTAYATLMKNNVSKEDMVFLTGSAGAASALTNGIANPGGNVTSEPGVSGYIMGIPMIVSAQCTISASTNGAAGYLFSREAVLAGIATSEPIGPEKSALTGGVEFATTLSYGFIFAEGVGDPRAYKFINP